MRQFDYSMTALASIGATAPFIGLLGTVWGIYRALIGISESGQMSIAAVASPISELWYRLPSACLWRFRPYWRTASSTAVQKPSRKIWTHLPSDLMSPAEQKD